MLQWHGASFTFHREISAGAVIDGNGLHERHFTNAMKCSSITNQRLDGLLHILKPLDTIISNETLNKVRNKEDYFWDVQTNVGHIYQTTERRIAKDTIFIFNKKQTPWLLVRNRNYTDRATAVCRRS
jgi:hypothetical protein